MENAKHLPLPLCYSLTKRRTLEEEFALEIRFSGNKGYNFHEAKPHKKGNLPFEKLPCRR